MAVAMALALARRQRVCSGVPSDLNRQHPQLAVRLHPLHRLPRRRRAPTSVPRAASLPTLLPMARPYQQPAPCRTQRSTRPRPLPSMFLPYVACDPPPWRPTRPARGPFLARGMAAASSSTGSACSVTKRRPPAASTSQPQPDRNTVLEVSRHRLAFVEFHGFESTADHDAAGDFLAGTR